MFKNAFISLVFICLCITFPFEASSHGGGKKEAMCVGVVQEVNIKKRRLKIATEPIKSLGWPELSMNWKVDDGVDISHLHPGDKISISLKQDNSRINYTITHIDSAS